MLKSLPALLRNHILAFLWVCVCAPPDLSVEEKPVKKAGSEWHADLWLRRDKIPNANVSWQEEGVQVFKPSHENRESLDSPPWLAVDLL